MAADSRAQRRIARLAWAGGWLLRLLGWTWRIRASHDEAWKRLRSEGKPFIFTLWHGELLPLLYQHRGEGVAVLISEHGDGEIIARIAMGLGYEPVRGSTSRGAARALLALTKELASGRTLAITPDGPRGPARSFAPGALIVAQRANAPMIAAAASVSWSWRLRTWDGFIIPKPFARISVSYSDPVRLEATSARDAATETDRMTAAMAEAGARAEAGADGSADASVHG